MSERKVLEGKDLARIRDSFRFPLTGKNFADLEKTCEEYKISVKIYIKSGIWENLLAEFKPKGYEINSSEYEYLNLYRNPDYENLELLFYFWTDDFSLVSPDVNKSSDKTYQKINNYWELIPNNFSSKEVIS